MKLLELRKEIKQQFQANNIEISDADFIISEVLGVKRNELIFVDEISSKQKRQINKCVKKRLKNCPVDNIFKKAYFYGLQFRVNDNVLSPRPESEILVDCALNQIEKNKFKTVLDLCSGSGCLAISIKKNSNAIVDAVDISKKAIKVAKFNAKQNDVQINFVQSDMFNLLTKTYDLIVSNPPYIESETIKTLDKEVQNHDPILALDGGADGLEFYKIINNNLDKYLNINGILILEIGDDQKEKIINLFNNYLLIDAIKDYANNDRILIFKKTKINLK